jgi:hypothetical protein
MSARTQPSCHDFSCSNCEQPIPVGKGHYQIDFDVRRMNGDQIEVLHAELIASLCMRCSLEYDLTQLDVPTDDYYYPHEPLGGSQSCVSECGLCRRAFTNGEQFEAALIVPFDTPSERDGPTVTISLCQECGAKRALRFAEPPSSKPGSPFCYVCGKQVGFKSFFALSDPADYTPLHHRTIELDAEGKVRLCQGCFLADDVLDDEG